jgi:ribose transport system permease protein
MSGVATEAVGHDSAAAAAPGPNRYCELGRDHAVVAILVVLIVALAVSADGFLTLRNWMNILDQAAPLTLVALGTTIVLISGAFDLSNGQMLSLAGVVGTEVAFRTANPVLGVVVGVLVGFPLGAANGALVGGLKINSFLATLATGLVMGGLALWVTAGYSRDLSANSTFTWLGSHRFGVVPVSVIVVALAFIALTLILTRTTLGRYAFAVGSNAEAARLSGISIVRVRLFAYAIGGCAASLGGMILATRTGVGQVVTNADTYTLHAIAAVVIGGTSILGGRGAIWRTLLGVLILALLQNAFNLMNVQPYWQQVVAGVIIVLAVIANAASGRR